MRLILLLLLLPLSSALSSPPISGTQGNNTGFAPSLEGWYDPSIAENSSVHLAFYGYTRDIPVSVSIEVAGMSLLLDNMTYPYEGLSLILARGTELGELTAMPSEGYPDFACDEAFTHGNMDFAWRCDFDGDYCYEIVHERYVEYDMDAVFTFRGVSGNASLDSNVLEVPEAVLTAMEDSSGAEMLDVSIEGDVVFIYEVNNRSFGFGSCADNLTNVTARVPYSLNASFVAAGTNKLFFLQAPILREQWFRNNRFNTVVLSQAPLYHAEVFRDGNTSREFTLRTFDTAENCYGLIEIISNKTDETGYLEGKSDGATPTPLLHENHTYAYAYQFNHSYQGLGWSNLSLGIEDCFEGEARYDERILSRMLSYDGDKTELGVPMDASLARRSSYYEKDELGSLGMGLGLIAIVLIVGFVNAWLLE